jgi:hypothetical protein
MDEKFKIGDYFDNAKGCMQVTDDFETTGGYGCSRTLVTKEDIQHLLNGGILFFDDGEYEHYLKLEQK